MFQETLLDRVRKVRTKAMCTQLRLFSQRRALLFVETPLKSKPHLLPAPRSTWRQTPFCSCRAGSGPPRCCTAGRSSSDRCGVGPAGRYRLFSVCIWQQPGPLRLPLPFASTAATAAVVNKFGATTSQRRQCPAVETVVSGRWSPTNRSARRTPAAAVEAGRKR